VRATEVGSPPLDSRSPLARPVRRETGHTHTHTHDKNNTIQHTARTGNGSGLASPRRSLAPRSACKKRKRSHTHTHTTRTTPHSKRQERATAAGSPPLDFRLPLAPPVRRETGHTHTHDKNNTIQHTTRTGNGSGLASPRLSHVPRSACKKRNRSHTHTHTHTHTTRTTPYSTRQERATAAGSPPLDSPSPLARPVRRETG